MALSARTCFWFNGGGLDAARLYVSLLPDSRIEGTFTAKPGDPPLVIDFTLLGTPYQILDAGPMYPLTPAASISVLTEDQAETDRLWAALLEGGTESRCGWLTDRWGLSWQIVPQALRRLLDHEDRALAGRVTQAMLGMGKIDVAALEAAAAEPAPA